MSMVVTSIKISEEEKKNWQSLAEFDGMTLNQMIREAVQERYEEFMDTQALNEAVKNDDGTRLTSAEIRRNLGL